MKINKSKELPHWCDACCLIFKLKYGVNKGGHKLENEALKGQFRCLQHPPTHVYSEINPIEINKAYSQVKLTLLCIRLQDQHVPVGFINNIHSLNSKKLIKDLCTSVGTQRQPRKKQTSGANLEVRHISKAIELNLSPHIFLLLVVYQVLHKPGSPCHLLSLDISVTTKIRKNYLPLRVFLRWDKSPPSRWRSK